ncbi:hypothetical protein ESCO_005404 [Escovopsis weberi]|uniref:Uncharacterized protein n=1 Tax=Escovopsis weberi TaxID=150374 RepID=A0A0M8N035_ESCWE|nr:hypothetical protein ESCO_005404 [Escovopsis weberi]
MNIGDSQLFKDFARPVLAQSTRGPLGILSGLSRSLGIDDARLEVFSITITNVTQEAISVSIHGRIAGTEPLSTISSLELDMVMRDSCFARLVAPKTRSGLASAGILIQGQRVEVLDPILFRAFIHDVIVNRVTRLRLVAAQCTATSFGGGTSYGLDLRPAPCFNVRLEKAHGREP